MALKNRKIAMSIRNDSETIKIIGNDSTPIAGRRHMQGHLQRPDLEASETADFPIRNCGDDVEGGSKMVEFTKESLADHTHFWLSHPIPL